MGSRDGCSPPPGWSASPPRQHAGAETDGWRPVLTNRLAVVELLGTPTSDWHIVRAAP